MEEDNDHLTVLRMVTLVKVFVRTEGGLLCGIKQVCTRDEEMLY